MLQDASHLMASKPAPLSLKQQSILPHGPDPWPADHPEKHKPVEKNHDPLRNFRKEKETFGEKRSQTHPETKLLEAPAKQQPQQTQPTEIAQNRQKPVDTEVLKTTGDTHKFGSNDQVAQSHQQKSISGISSENKDPQYTPTTQNSQAPGGRGQHAKTSDLRQQEDRKLELEGAPKNRKVNPLDRVVAKLSGKTEDRNDAEGGGVKGKNSLQNHGGVEEVNPKAVVKNVTVNLTKLMTVEDEVSEVKQK